MKKITSLLSGLILVLSVGSAWADVAVERYIKSGGIGGLGAFEGTTQERLQGLKKSEETATKFTGSIMSKLASGSQQVAITRIDKGVVWSLDPKKQTYTETPIETFKPASPAGKEQSATQEKPKVRVTKTEFSVKKTGAKETINGFACEEYLMTWVIEMEDLETKAKMKNTMLTNLWTTPETAAIKKLQADEAAFTKAYLKKIGMPVMQSEMKQFGVEALIATHGASAKDMEKAFGRVKSEMAKVKGYPIRTVITWEAQEQGSEAAAAAQESEPMETPDLSGGVGGLIGGIMGSVAKKVIGGSKPAGDGPFFSSTTEIKGISTEPIAGTIFDIPAGYTKQNQ
jgi:hypothetical protein